MSDHQLGRIRVIEETSAPQFGHYGPRRDYTYSGNSAYAPDTEALELSPTLRIVRERGETFVIQVLGARWSDAARVTSKTAALTALEDYGATTFQLECVATEIGDTPAVPFKRPA